MQSCCPVDATATTADRDNESQLAVLLIQELLGPIPPPPPLPPPRILSQEEEDRGQEKGSKYEQGSDNEESDME